MAHILVSGIAVLDFIFYMNEMPEQPHKHIADDATVASGGCAAVAAIAVSRLGGNASLITRLGDDTVGALTTRRLEQAGVDCNLSLRSEHGQSSFSSIYIDATGERQIVNFPGAHLHQDLASLALPADHPVDAVLVDTRWPAAADHMMALAAARGVPGIVDCESGDDRITPAIQTASHVALSAQGLRIRTGEQDLACGLQRFRQHTQAWLCVTDGDNDVLVMADDEIESVPTYSINPVDTLGAGDVWHGAFALQLAQGIKETDAVRFANAVAATKCTRAGGGDGAPTQEEVNLFLSQQSE